MASSIYFCTKENNTCPKQEICKRYMQSEGESVATLFKMACTEDNGYVLYIKHTENNEQKEVNSNAD